MQKTELSRIERESICGFMISQKNSDTSPGYDRSYDPVMSEVYQAEIGFVKSAI